MLSHEGVSEGRRGKRASAQVTHAGGVRMIRMVARMIRVSGVRMIRVTVRMIRLRRAASVVFGHGYPDDLGEGPDDPAGPG